MQRGNGAVIGKQNTPTTSVATGVWALNEVQRAVLGGNWPASTIVDPYFDYTTLLLHGNGTNGAQNNTFLDSSTNNFTITRNGNTTQGTFTPYGSNWSNYLNGSSSLSANVSGVAAGTSTFTFEVWVFLTAYPGSDAPFYDTRSTNGASTTGMQFGVYSTGALKFYDGTETNLGGTVPLNQWVHIALVRNGSNVMTPYINGTATGTTVSSTRNFTDQYFWIGSVPGPASPYINAYFSNLRWVVGTAVYTSNFTPSTSPLTAITNTKLLTCQSNRFIDNSTNAFAITVNGSPSVQRFSPFNPTTPYAADVIGGSGYFDGSGDYLTLAPGAAFAFGTGDFTVEAWIYPTAALGQMYIIDARNSGQTSTWSFNFGYGGTSNEFNWGSSGSVIANGGTTSVIQNAWNHVVYTRSGTSGALFANGVRVASVTDSTNYSTSPTTSYIGSRFSADAPYFFQGYMAVRVVKGTAVYSPSSSTLTVPTSPLTAVTNTVLLLSMTNGGIIDNAMMNDLETVGNAQISTAQSKFGGGSLAFDGSGDWVNAPPTQNLEFGSGDFTFEFWLYPLDTTRRAIYHGSDGADWSIGIDFQSQKVCIWASSNGSSWNLINSDGGGNGIGTITVSTNAWTHVALVRSGTTWQTYINGVRDLNLTGISGSIVNRATYAKSIGKWFFTNGVGTPTMWNGYIDDLRITKGYARYTGNFTPPTLPFPDQ